ncbi:MAG: peroxide stress protein YaaA [Methanomicrobiaceae archaeon]|nr:peroxide stress protein YaaA [Methanomicrobiaceae archaeon]
MEAGHRQYSPDSRVLVLIIDSFHKKKNEESATFKSGSSLFESEISETSKKILRDNRIEIFHHIKNNEILWPDCTEELEINKDLKEGKDIFGDDVEARYLPAVYRYWGDFYEGLDDDGKEKTAHSHHHILILSALYGLLMPFEPIQYYACQFGDKNISYDIWTRNHDISKVFSDYIQTYNISRIFDFTSCAVTAYHECMNWDFIKETTGAEVFHCYHRFARRDQALKPFGLFVKDELILKSEDELLSITPGMATEEILLSDTINLSENETLRRLIDKGEDDLTEFKTTALWSIYISQNEIANSTSREVRQYGKNASKFIIARSIASFLNANGGNLIIGINEGKKTNEKTVEGIEKEYHKLRDGDRNTDGYRLMLVDMIIKKYLPEILTNFSNYVNVTFHPISGKTVCWLQIKPAKRPVFVEINGEELFFSRIDASSRIVSGKALAKYILDRYAK